MNSTALASQTKEFYFQLVLAEDETIENRVGVLEADADGDTAFLYRTTVRVRRVCQRLNPLLIPLLALLMANNTQICLEGHQRGRTFTVTGIRPVDGSTLTTQQLRELTRQLLARDPASDAPSHRLVNFSNDQLDKFYTISQELYSSQLGAWFRAQFSALNRKDARDSERRAAAIALTNAMNISWKTSLPCSPSLSEARSTLDRHIYGMEPVKQSLLEALALVRRTGKLPSYGLLLSGPAGCGKTTIALAVAEAMSLPMIKLELPSFPAGESLVGSSRIYSNAHPGALIQELARVGQTAAVVVLDEIDKAGEDTGSYKGVEDALLAVTDGRGSFWEAFMEMDIPTDHLFFVATCNDPDAVSKPLRDRFVELDLPGYSPAEKEEILRHHLLKRTREKFALKPSELALTDGAVKELCRSYAVAPGVRDLEQCVEKLASRRILELEQHKKATQLDEESLGRIFGPPKNLSSPRPAAVGQIRAVTLESGRVQFYTVQAQVMLNGFSTQTFLGISGQAQRDRFSAAVFSAQRYLECRLPAIRKSRMDVVVSVWNGDGEVSDCDLGGAVFTAVASAVTGIAVPGDIAFFGGCDLLGRLYVPSQAVSIPAPELAVQGIHLLCAPSELSDQSFQASRGVTLCQADKAAHLCELVWLTGKEAEESR